MGDAEDASKDDQPEIIIDSDWKEQVAKEKAQVDSGDADDAPGVVTDTPESESSELPPPPEASFEVMVTMLFTQAMSLLGQMPDPNTGESKVNKPYAKHYIDTLEMLVTKTEGNLSDTESTILSEALHALRMAYVNTKS